MHMPNIEKFLTCRKSLDHNRLLLTISLDLSNALRLDMALQRHT